MINFDYKFVMVALMFICMDIATGVVGSMIRGEFKSQKMREGGKRKLFLLIVIVFGAALDVAQQLVDIGFSIPATTAICGYIALMEILSVIENINMTFPNALPEALTSILYSTAKDKGVVTDEESNN